jgi:PIN domain nuclease of toxin-antitoxin system
LLWWVFGDQALSRAARDAIGDGANEVFVSAASAWEITTKFRIGKLDHAAIVANDVEGTVKARGFSDLPITVRHAQTAGSLAGKYGDPFDRMLIAQSIVENMVLVSNETRFDAFAVKRLW